MRRCLMVGIVLAAFCGVSTFAEARPPTVMNSPGYDRRLQESRSQLGNSSTTTVPTNPTVSASKRSKKKQTN